MSDTPAVLVLEDGRTFYGRSYGAEGATLGELVFDTGMTGHQEALTDPSHHRQIVVMTAPHIGNTGVNDEDMESNRIWVSGCVVREPPRTVSSWRARRGLDEELGRYDIIAIAMPGTRALTRHLRERGAMRGGIFSGEAASADRDVLVRRVRDSPSTVGADLAPEAGTSVSYVVASTGAPRFRVAAVDLGVKAASLRCMAERGCDVRVLPAASTATDILALEPDGVLVAGGPGDPTAADGAATAVRGVLDGGVPTFAIGLGHQILGRALGLGTYKLPHGHHGINQPVRHPRTGRVCITSHNHDFAVDAPAGEPFTTPYGPAEATHVALNDGVVEGLELRDRPTFGVQYHPEAAPGPHDAVELFDRFVELMGGVQDPSPLQRVADGSDA